MKVLAEAHTPYLTAQRAVVSDCGGVGVGGRNTYDKTGFYKAMLFVPKYLMNMLLK